MARIADHSSYETKNAIINAFLELYEKERLEKITIGAITKKAQVNRGTFYYYFQDIYELLEHIEQNYLENIQQAITELIAGVFYNDLLDRLNQVLQFYEKSKELLFLFLVKRPNRKVIDATKKIAVSYVLSLMGLTEQDITPEQECIISYIVNAQIGIVIYWLENDQALSIEQLVQIMVRVNKEGPITVLSEKLLNNKSLTRG